MAQTVVLFYQVYAVRHTVYGFELPFQPGWLSAFDALSFDFGTFLFPSWSCVGGLTTRITFNGLWPLLLMVSVTLVLLARATIRKGSVRGALLLSRTSSEDRRDRKGGHQTGAKAQRQRGGKEI